MGRKWRGQLGMDGETIFGIGVIIWFAVLFYMKTYAPDHADEIGCLIPLLFCLVWILAAGYFV